MNKHLYSLEFASLVMKLCINHVNFDKKNIFRFSYDKSPLLALENYISLILLKKKTEESFPTFIKAYNCDEENDEKITSNTLTILSQQVILNGNLLPLDNLSTYAAWTLFFNDLKVEYDLYLDSPKTFSLNLKMDNLKNIFTAFLNTLCAINNEKTAEVFHNFLHFTYLAIKHSDKNGTTQAGMAKLQSICMLNGLEFEGKMTSAPLKKEVVTNSNLVNAKDKNKGHKLKNTDFKLPLQSEFFAQTFDLKNENSFFGDFIDSVLNFKQFKTLFAINNYHPQKTQRFEKVLSNIITNLWKKPDISVVPYSLDIFGPSLSPRELPFQMPLPIIKNREDIAFVHHLSEKRDDSPVLNNVSFSEELSELKLSSQTEARSIETKFKSEAEIPMYRNHCLNHRVKRDFTQSDITHNPETTRERRSLKKRANIASKSTSK